MRKLTKVVSGGQTGVDQAALRAARDAGLQIGGWCPPARECEAGVISAEFPLKETERERSLNAPDVPRSQRTEWNVRDSDATLVITDRDASHSDAATEERDSGTDWTIECARRYKRPLLVCDVDDAGVADEIARWLAANGIGTLNVAGPADLARYWRSGLRYVATRLQIVGRAHRLPRFVPGNGRGRPIIRERQKALLPFPALVKSRAQRGPGKAARIWKRLSPYSRSVS